MIVAEPDPWYNDQTYVDTLNPAAIRKFVEVTYEAYFREVGSEFGKTIPAIFTDEPQFTRKSALKFAREKRDAVFRTRTICPRAIAPLTAVTSSIRFPR